MKEIIISALIFLVLLVFSLSFFGWTVYKKTHADIFYVKTDLSTLKLAEILSTGVTKFKVEYKIKVWNRSKVKIPLKDLLVEIYYKDIFIGQSDKVLSEKIEIKPNQVTTFDKTLEFYVTKDIFLLLSRALKEKDLIFNYKLKFKVFGIEVPAKATQGQFDLAEYV